MVGVGVRRLESPEIRGFPESIKIWIQSAGNNCLHKQPGLSGIPYLKDRRGLAAAIPRRRK